MRHGLTLRANSMMMTLYGDVFAPRRQSVWLGSLIELLPMFDLSPRQVRTSAFRLTADHWFDVTRLGRRSYYALSPTGTQRVEHAQQRIYEFSAQPWNGVWTLVFIDAKWKLSARQILKRELLWDGFGQLAQNILAHPRAKAQSLTEIIQACKAESHITLLTASGIDGYSREPLIQLMRQAFNLAHIDTAWVQFINRFSPIASAASALTPAESFYARILLIHEYRRILLRDPNLPEALLPPEWSGLAARQLCQTLYQTLKASSEQFLMDHVQTLDGQLAATPLEISIR